MVAESTGGTVQVAGPKGETPGAAALAIFLLIIAAILVIAAVRGTYRDVWAAIVAPPASHGAGEQHRQLPPEGA